MQLEKRVPADTLMLRFKDLFENNAGDRPVFSEQGFRALRDFLTGGDRSFQGLAVQAGAKWSNSSQKVTLRNVIQERGVMTASCLWAYRLMRGHHEILFQQFDSVETAFMQILLLKEVDPAEGIPFLIDQFVTGRDLPEELRSASILCLLRLLDSSSNPDLVRSLQSRYPRVEALFQWRPGIPGRYLDLNDRPKGVSIDFRQLVGSVHGMKDLSSLTRVVYLFSLFYIPLSEKEWRSLLLTRTDQLFFQRLKSAGIVESTEGGFALSSDAAKRAMVRKFLYEKYSLARETVSRNRAVRRRETRERQVRTRQLDRQALEIVSDGIICVESEGRLYYMNAAAERMLGESRGLKERLFGAGSLEDALCGYSRAGVLSRVTATAPENGDAAEVFGDRVVISSAGKRFEVELGAQVILLRDVTDQHLIDEEIGKLYRHEMKAALDVMGAGLASVKEELAGAGGIEEGIRSLDQVERKRVELFSMLEERIDFIRLHSDSFRIRPVEVNLNLVADRCVGNYRETTMGKGVEIDSNHLDVSAVMVLGEESFLVRALDNIIRNGVKFSEKGSKIKVVVGCEGSDGFVRVEDTGPGIPEENLGMIFELGFTTGGTGRGLYLARRIAAAHNGRIGVKSELGRGSRFTLRLPIVTEA